jgi:hypothetical protein
VKRARLFLAIERYLEGTLAPAERAELEAAVRADPEIRRAFAADVRTARQLRAALRSRRPEETWARVAALTGEDEAARRARVADGVEARLAAGPRPRRRALALPIAGAAASIAVASIVALGLRTHRPAEAPPAEGPPAIAAAREHAAAPARPGPRASDRAPAAVPRSTPPPASAEGSASGPAAFAAPGPRPRRARRAAAQIPLVDVDGLRASEGPVLAARADLRAFVAFDAPARLPRPLQRRLASGQVALGAGVVGRALEIPAGPRGAAREGPGVRATLALARADEPGLDEAHLRFYVRFDPGFDFRAPGALPGLCVGVCGPGKAKGTPGVGRRIRVRWTRAGELAVELPPQAGVPLRARRWRRALVPGRWHVVELRVRLEAAGARDGEVEGWFDGARALALSGLALRPQAEARVTAIALDAFAKAPPAGSAGAEARFAIDDLVVARGYVGLKEGR